MILFKEKDYLNNEISKLIEELVNEKLLSYIDNSYFIIDCLLKIEEFLYKLKFNRKRTIIYYYIIKICKSNSSFYSFTKYALNKISNEINIIDLSSNLSDHSTFLTIHDQYNKHKLKKDMFIINETGAELTKKKINKDQTLTVKNRRDQFKLFITQKYWDYIQLNYLKEVIYNDVSSTLLKILSCLNVLQLFYNSLSYDDQTEIYQKIRKYSSLYQGTIECNLLKLPYLVSLIPVCSSIKFDTKQIHKNSESENKRKDSVFLYNPWDQNKDLIEYK